MIQYYYNVQIYNEQITDLLDPSQKNLQVKKLVKRPLFSGIGGNPFLSLLIYICPIPLQIREDVRTACVYVESLTKELVFTMKDVTQLLVKVCLQILTSNVSHLHLFVVMTLNLISDICIWHMPLSDTNFNYAYDDFVTRLR